MNPTQQYSALGQAYALMILAICGNQTPMRNYAIAHFIRKAKKPSGEKVTTGASA